jgi:superfamily II DNA or RNA helicase
VAVESRNQLIVEAYLQYASDRPTLVFAVNVDHVEQLRKAFESAGISVASVAGEMPLEDRRRVLTEFRKGRYSVLVNCQILTEGYDEQRIGCVIMARPTKSRTLYQQSVGRGFRVYPDGPKKDCLILDVLDESVKYELITASHLFGADVPDCGGEDVLRAVDQDLVHRLVFPLSPTKAQLRRWKTGVDVEWPESEWPNLTGFHPPSGMAERPATKQHLKRIGRYGFRSHRELTWQEANYLLERCAEVYRRYPTPATPEQERVLRAKGLFRKGMNKRQAGGAMAS